MRPCESSRYGRRIDGPEAWVDFTGHDSTGEIRGWPALFEASAGDDRARFQARAQAGYTRETLAHTDFVNASMGVPIFSARVVEKIGKALGADATGFPCTITCQGERFGFFAARAEARTNLIDESRSLFRQLTDGSRSLPKSAYWSEFDREFLLARDHHEMFDWAASERFKRRAEQHGLAIQFLPREQTS